jgi:hypothetical protein
MDKIKKELATSVALVLIAMLLITAPASAISADLAIKCRSMAIKAHPQQQPGTARGYARAERDFFRLCVSKNGEMSDSDTQRNVSPAPK